jgi:VCBS repeat-containing protein
MPSPINGTSGADTLPGTAGDDVINGLGGNDKIDGGAGADQIDGGAGNDIIKGGDGNDIVTGGLGNDTIVGGTGLDTAVYLTTTIAAASTAPTPVGSWSGALLTLATGSEGTDILNQVESLNFNGTTFAVTGYNASSPYNVVAQLGSDAATTTDDGASVTGNVLANDYDVDSQLVVTGARLPPASAPGEAMPLDPKGPQATNILDVAGAYGTLHIATNGTYTYTASGSGHGVDHFQYSVTDGGVTNWVNLNITVTHVNHAPQAASVETFGGPEEDAPYTFNEPGTLANVGVDADHDPLTFILVSAPQHGDLDYHSDGTFTYTPDANFNGTDSFFFKVNDGTADSNVSEWILHVAPVNDLAVAYDASGSLNEDFFISGSASASDVDGGALTFILVSGPVHGSLSFGSNGQYLYSPDANYHGSDSFTFKVNDGTADSNIATISLNVSSVNDAPSNSGGFSSTNEDTAVSGQVYAYDADNDPLTFSLVGGGPSHGSLDFHSDGTYTYTPDANFHGSDSFQVKANDGTVDSNTATVYLTVNPVNDAPVADGPITTGGILEDGSFSHSLAIFATDADNDPLTYSVVSGPAHGALSLNSDGSFTYTPDANYNGSDSFTWKANDGTADSNVSTWVLGISPVNDLPVASFGSASTNEDTTVSGSAHATDVDNDALTYSLVGGVQHGSLSFHSDGTYTYTPTANYHGSDSFTFRANDGTGNSNTTTVAINVASVNDAPVAVDGVSTPGVPEDGTFSLTTALFATDADGDSLTYSLVDGPAHGSISFHSDGSFTYTPAANYHGGDSFTWKANDGHTDSNVATWQLGIDSVNDLPVAQDGSAAAPEDTIITGAVHATDVDGDTLTYSVNSSPSHGSLSLHSDGTYTYTPDANYNGADSFEFIANDGHGNSNVGTVHLAVNPPVEDAPTASGGSNSTNEDTSVTGHVYGGDVDDDPITYSVVSGPAHGSLNLASDGSYTYTPGSNYHGSDSFTFKTSDGTLDSAPATISLTVNSVNDAPNTSIDFNFTDEDTPVSGAATAGDADGDPLTYSLVGGPSHGSVVFHSDGTYTYTPTANFHGTDSFTFKANDGTVDSNTGTVAIGVASVNDAPVITPTVSVSTFEGADAFAGWATIGHTAGGAGPTGTNWSGQAGVIYGDGVPFEQIAGFADLTNLDAAIAGAQASGSGVRLDFDTTAGQPYELRLRFSTGDTVDGDAAIFVVDETGQIFGLRTLNNGGNLRLHNDSTAGGHHTLYLVVIGGGNAGAVPQLQIDGFLIAGVAANIDTTHSYVKEDSVLNSHVYASDVDGDALTYALASGGQASHGTVAVNANGSFTYTPTGNYNGTDSFTYQVSDGHGGVTTSTQQITVESVNDLPVAAGASASTNEDTSVSGSVHATDVDGDSLTYGVASTTQHGSLSFHSDGTYTYTPNANYHGADSFDFSVSDGHGGTDYGHVSISVASVNDVPVAQAASFTTAEDGNISSIVHATDADGDSLTYSLYGGAPAPPSGSSAIPGVGVQHGQLTFHSDGTFYYVPDANYHGSDSFQYRAYDGQAYSDPVTVLLNVTPVNDVPVANPAGPFNMPEDAIISTSASGSDADGDSLTWSVVSGLAGLTFNADGTWSFDSTANTTAQALNDGETADLTFSYRAFDGVAYSNTVTATLHIAGLTEVLDGTALRDVLNGSAYGDRISGLGGNDDLYGLGGNDTLNGNDGSDKLYGGDGADILAGGDGADTVNGDAGNDQLTGGEGNDTMDGGDGVDIVDGGAGNDVVKGGAGNDFVYGGDGNDNVQGGVGDDFVYGGAGSDSLNGGTGADTFVFVAGDLTNLAGTTDTITDFKAAQGDIVDLHSIDANANVIGDQAFTFVGATFGHHAGEMTLSFNSGTNTTTLGLDTNGDGVAEYLLLLTGNVNNPNGWLL